MFNHWRGFGHTLREVLRAKSNVIRHTLREVLRAKLNVIVERYSFLPLIGILFGDDGSPATWFDTVCRESKLFA